MGGGGGGGGGGAQADRFDHGLHKGLRQGPTQEAITQTRLLWDTRVHPQVDQLMVLWAQSTTVRRITENHTFTENHRKPPKTTWKIIFIGELYPPSICFLVVYVYI